jgi:tRNA(Ile)-lysidine synthase
MKNAVLRLCKSHGINATHKLLCAVSGGMDSVAMLRVLVELGLNCGIAHCNFKLRGKESDRDEEFVRKLAEQFELPIFVTTFDTLDYAHKNNLSVQMAARELRYDWFEKVREENNYDYIAVAHHADDEIETVLINLIRGTGISGLTGISSLNGRVLRPLIKVWNKDIADYCKTYKLKYRNDSSNSETKYARNLLRHQVIPLLEQINPGFKQTMNDNIEHFSATEKLINSRADELQDKFVVIDDETVRINIVAMPDSVFKHGIFFEMMRNLGFNATEASEIERLRDSQSGKMLIVNDLRVLKDRGEILIEKNELKQEQDISIPYGTRFISEPIVLNIEYVRISMLYNIPKTENIACLDIEKLKFPLQLRKWKDGDKFMPLGMQNFKKLSDFFSDLKFSIFDKEDTWLLCSDEDIAWIIGYRIDDRFKITPDTRDVLKLSI